MSRINTKPREEAEAVTEELEVQVSIPGHGSFTVTGDAAAMIRVFGGTLHCYVGGGGCRKQGLYFSRTEPKKPLRCLLNGPGVVGDGHRDDDGWLVDDELVISVSHELAPKLDGAILDFGTYNKMQRFVWLATPAVKGPACACLRSIGPAAGKHSPCLVDQGVGLSDI